MKYITDEIHTRASGKLVIDPKSVKVSTGQVRVDGATIYWTVK